MIPLIEIPDIEIHASAIWFTDDYIGNSAASLSVFVFNFRAATQNHYSFF
jgi:hypothetical protein